MSPEYHSGDYVIASRIPFMFGFYGIGSVLVIKSAAYGILIKKISRIDKENGRFYFKGTDPESLSEEKIGAVGRKDILGSVIIHFKS